MNNDPKTAVWPTDWGALEKLVEAETAKDHARIIRLCGVAALTAMNEMSTLRHWLQRVLPVESNTEVEEVILQTLLFAGFPRTIEALNILRKLAPDVKPQGHVHFPTRSSGEKTCQAIYGTKYDRLLTNMDNLHPDLTRWILEDGYGRVLSRHGLDIATREMCVLVTLEATGMLNQFKAHWSGATNVGWDLDRIVWLTNCFAFIIPVKAKDAFIKYLESQNKDRGQWK